MSSMKNSDSCFRGIKKFIQDEEKDMDNINIKSKLRNAKDIEEVKSILTEAGEKYEPDDIERIWQEIEHHRPDGKRKLDQDEMDAVAGGTDRNWIDDGCAATCDEDSWCWSDDKCYTFSVTYDEFHEACINGGHHDYKYAGNNTYNNGNTLVTYKRYICSRCGSKKLVT